MQYKSDKALRDASPYNAVITREQFLFYEMRTTARLLNEGMDEETVIAQIVENNLFQYPTERMIRRMAQTCIHRLNAMEDPSLITAIATQPSDTAKQICLYACMCYYRLVWDFMITVIGEKYRSLDTSFGKIDVEVFLMRLREQDDGVATWSDTTMAKVRQILIKMLVENEYIDNANATRINPVLISSVLENAIREDGQERALVAFNCLT